MLLELVISRGLAIRIDGHAPASEGWSYGDNDAGTGFELDVQVGPHRVTSIDFGCDMEDFNCGEVNPTELTLTTDQGTFVLPVIDNFTAADDDTYYDVTLTDGTTRDIDAYQSYVRAGEGPPAAKVTKRWEDEN